MKNLSAHIRRGWLSYAWWLIIALAGVVAPVTDVVAQVPYHRIPDHSGMAARDAAANNQRFGELHAMLGHRPPNRKQTKYKFHIVFKNDSTCSVSGEIDNLTGSYSLYVEKRDDTYLIRPGDTKAVRSNNMDGIVLDECWLFLIKKGRINAYSAYPDKKGDISAVQKGDGEILPFTPTTMKEFVAGHKRAMAFVEEGDLYMALLHYND